MALPTNREEFKQMCLRQLGAPVIEINVADEQIEDCIDLSLQFFADYHFDATEKVYYKYAPTDIDRQNGYFNLPDNIIGAIRIFNLGMASAQGGSSLNMFDVQYQLVMSDLFNIASQSLVPYYMSMERLNLINQLLTGTQPVRYNRTTNKFYVDMNWEKLPPNHFLIIEAYQVINPDEFPDVWKERWLIKYCTALIKKIQGINLKKFGNLQLIGGVSFNGQQIYDEAVEEIQQIEGAVLSSYSLPVLDVVA